jgi:indole-3-glycerol phosphate synthase
VNELERIVARTRVEVGRRRAQIPEAELAAAGRWGSLHRGSPPRPFAAALSRPGLSVIAEHKRRSPSAGLIRAGIELEDVVGAYERGGARALSVLTEEAGFGGSLADLERARSASSLPILRKDFIVDPYQVAESYFGGADAILLIVAALEPGELAGLYARARSLELGVLVEVHDARELELAAEVGAEVIGINNRDLTTLAVDTSRTFELLPLVPPGVVTVSESGWRTAAELQRLVAAGVDGVLIGEALMRAPDIEAACRSLTGAPVRASVTDS